MRLMQTLYSHLSLSLSHSKILYSNPCRAFLWFSSVPSLPRTHTATLRSNPIIFNYLIETFAFSEPEALSISNRFPWIKTIKKPESVVQFLKQLGFTDIHIRSSIRSRPHLLFSDIEKTLKPKLQYFQGLGLTGPDLGKFISRNSEILARSLEKKLIPCIDVIRKTLGNERNNQDLIWVLRRYNRITSIEPESRLLGNIAFLESCGIVGSQLSMLLTKQPWIFVLREPALRNLISRVLDMGFLIDSRMLVHAVDAVSSVSGETLSRKLEFLRSFGFSMDQCMEMLRRHPGLLRTSEAKLKTGIEFFMNDMKYEKSVLVRQPNCLLHSMEKRVFPRYRVLQVMKSKKLLKKEPQFLSILHLTEEKFLEKFISRFRDDAEELLVAYKGDLLDSSMK